MPGKRRPRPIAPRSQEQSTSARGVLCGLLLLSTALLGLTVDSRAQSTGVAIQVDAAANRKPINPNIYGVAFGTTAQLNELNVPLNRQGGNVSSRWNWQQNSTNRGQDWYYESLPESGSAAGGRADSFIEATRNAGAEPAVTVPMLEWVSRLGANRGKLCSFSIAKYGPQQDNDAAYFPDAGNGVRTNGTLITNNDPNDANTPNSVSFQQGWLQHLVGKWGTRANGGVKYYFLDNEPGLWHDTHRDVQPTGATMAQVRDKIIAYSDMIRSVDPGAVIMGPEEWGWSGYFYSGYDLQWGSENGWNNLPDRAANGGKDFLPWLLQQLRARDLQTGKKSIDVFTVHYYPQSGEYGSSTTTTMQNRRNKSTRSLWDPTYVDQSWIGEVVQLIPLLKSWVNAYYPGLPVGITEYNWGAENHINGATTQADILGIFGREGLALANYWTVPPTGSPVYNAFRMYRNYDGSKSTFGDVSVRATVPNPDNVSAFAAQRTSDGALTVMVINKQLSTAQAVTVGLANFASTGAAQVWQLTSSNSITRLADATVTNNTITATLPAQSITLYVLPKQPEAPAGPPAPMKLRAVSGDTQASLTWLPAPGASSYRLYRAARSTGPWDLVQSTSSTATVDGGLVNGLTYYYAVRTVSGEAESVNSNLAAAKPQAAATDPVGPPGAPTRLKATPGDGTATLSWTPSVNAPFYRVYRSLSKTGPFGLRKTVKDPSWVDTAVTNGTLYYFAVTSMNSAGESAQSNIVVVRPGTVVVTTPPPPTFTASVGTPAWTPPGGTAAINLSVTCASSSLSNGVVALEIHSGSTRLHQELWTGQSFTSGQVRSYTYNWLAPSVPGNYTVKVGVYGPGSTPQYYWNGNAGTVTVTTPTFTSSVSVSPNPVSVGSNATITATVTCVSGALTDGVIDVEIYDANRVRRRQQFWLGQNLAAGETVTRTFTWAPSIASTYTVKVGVFGYDWDPLHDWNDAAGTFTAN